MRIGKRIALLAALTGAFGVGAPIASAAGHGAATKVKKPQAIRIVIKDVSTPDGESGPVLVGPNGVGAKSLFTAHAGRKVVITFVNQSKTMHSFTVSGLGLNTMILVNSTAKATFTPKKTGTYSWLCTPPCGTWVMANNGYMKGSFTVSK